MIQRAFILEYVVLKNHSIHILDLVQQGVDRWGGLGVITLRSLSSKVRSFASAMAINSAWVRVGVVVATIGGAAITTFLVSKLLKKKERRPRPKKVWTGPWTQHYMWELKSLGRSYQEGKFFKRAGGEDEGFAVWDMCAITVVATAAWVDVAGLWNHQHRVP